MSTQEKKNTVVKKQSEITDIVMKKIQVFEKSGELRLPKDYSPENALKGAQLILADMKVKGVPVLQHCTKVSIANSLFKMVTMGLSVVKKQGNFIPYGNELAFQEEYTGNIVLAKRYGGLAENPKAHVIYEGDEFDFEFDAESGHTKILKHKPSLESLGNRGKIKGAYCIYTYKKNPSDSSSEIVTDVEVMNFEQIENSWKQGAMKGNSGAHNGFPDQMSKKTVINRAMKLLVRGSDDAALFDYDEDRDLIKESVDNEIYENANQSTIDIEDTEYEEVKENPQVEPKEPEPNPEKEPKAETKVQQGQTKPMF